VLISLLPDGCSVSVDVESLVSSLVLVRQNAHRHPELDGDVSEDDATDSVERIVLGDLLPILFTLSLGHLLIFTDWARFLCAFGSEFPMVYVCI
jgi:hypothetical protein